MADMIRDEMGQTKINFLTHSPSNQIFPILPNSLIKELRKKYDFIIWEKVDDEHSAIRLVTSGNKEEAVRAFINDMKKDGITFKDK